MRSRVGRRSTCSWGRILIARCVPCCFLAGSHPCPAVRRPVGLLQGNSPGVEAGANVRGGGGGGVSLISVDRGSFHSVHHDFTGLRHYLTAKQILLFILQQKQLLTIYFKNCYCFLLGVFHRMSILLFSQLIRALSQTIVEYLFICIT